MAKSSFSVGTDVAWFCTLYTIAAYIKRYGFNWHSKTNCLSFIGGGIGTGVLYLIAEYVFTHIIEVDIASTAFSYNNPSVLLTSLGLFELCRNINVRNRNLKKTIFAFGKLTFGVYLIHNHFTLRTIIWNSYNRRNYYNIMYLY